MENGTDTLTEPSAEEFFTIKGPRSARHTLTSPLSDAVTTLGCSSRGQLRRVTPCAPCNDGEFILVQARALIGRKCSNLIFKTRNNSAILRRGRLSQNLPGSTNSPTRFTHSRPSPLAVAGVKKFSFLHTEGFPLGSTWSPSLNGGSFRFPASSNGITRISFFQYR